FVLDPAPNRVGSIVLERMRCRRRRAVDNFKNAVIVPIERILEAGRLVDIRCIELTAKRKGDRLMLGLRTVVPEDSRGSYVYDGHRHGAANIVIRSVFIREVDCDAVTVRPIGIGMGGGLPAGIAGEGTAAAVTPVDHVTAYGVGPRIGDRAQSQGVGSALVHM